jgi:DNA-binding response OmpR family regulator
MSARGPRLLVVDDEAGLQKLIGRHAERAGFDVTVAVTAAEALELARTVSPDAILLDLLLPDGSGIDVLARLKAEPQTAGIPVVVWSGSDVDEGRSKALEAGAIDYFEKNELKEIVARLTQLFRARGG